MLMGGSNWAVGKSFLSGPVSDLIETGRKTLLKSPIAPSAQA
jgi:hypothetical protein